MITAQHGPPQCATELPLRRHDFMKLRVVCGVRVHVCVCVRACGERQGV